MRRLISIIAVSLPVVLACDEQDTTGPATPGHVAVGDNYFAPVVIHPNASGVVTWTFGGNAVHNVVFEIGQGGRVTPDVASGVYMRDFATEPDGTYPYQCTLHSGMVGQVVKP